MNPQIGNTTIQEGERLFWQQINKLTNDFFNLNNEFIHNDNKKVIKQKAEKVRISAQDLINMCGD